MWEVAVAAASDGSSLSTAPSVAVLYLLTQLCGSEIAIQMISDMEQQTATVTTLEKGISALASTLETVPVMETPMVTRDGCQCLV